MKTEFRNRFFAIGLLFALSIPISINSLHYVIFHHHLHDFFYSDGKNFVNNLQTHSRCLWLFATEELTDNSIVFSQTKSTFFPHRLLSPQHYCQKAYQDISLRAPPSL